MNAKACTLLTLIAVALVGCSDSDTQAPPQTSSQTPAALQDVLTSTPLDDATDIIKAQKTVAEGDAITLRGLVGGIANPLPDQRAIVTMIDESVPKTCGADPSDHCKTPWDYCCEPLENRKKAMASVQVLGPDGKVLQISLQGLGGLKPFSTIAVHGTVRSVEPGQRLIIDADKIHVISKDLTGQHSSCQCGH